MTLNQQKKKKQMEQKLKRKQKSAHKQKITFLLHFALVFRNIFLRFFK